MTEELMDFAKRYDDFIDSSPDYIREIAKQFYELGRNDAEKKCAVVYVPYPIDSKEMKRKLLGKTSDE